MAPPHGEPLIRNEESLQLQLCPMRHQHQWVPRTTTCNWQGRVIALTARLVPPPLNLLYVTACPPPIATRPAALQEATPRPVSGTYSPQSLEALSATTVGLPHIPNVPQPNSRSTHDFQNVLVQSGTWFLGAWAFSNASIFGPFDQSLDGEIVAREELDIQPSTKRLTIMYLPRQPSFSLVSHLGPPLRLGHSTSLSRSQHFCSRVPWLSSLTLG